MGETEEFNTLTFEKKLMQLKDTQESIQSLSAWCLKQRPHHKKIVSSWLNVLKRVKVEQRLTLFYLANDVIQYSKRKNYEFVESWGLNLQKATPLVRDEKVRPKILRIFNIWEQRSVYDDEFLSDLTGLLSAGAIKKTDDDPLDFQPQQLVNKIRQCTVLEADTELRLKAIYDNELELSDADILCATLKDKNNKDDIEKELNEGIMCVERYTQALQREIVAREALLALLTSANQYYSTQRGEVKVVAYAYKNFGARVRALKRKLDELIPTLPSAAPSPPHHDEEVPSPGPDEDLDLPGAGDSIDNDVSYNIDQTFNTSISADGSLYNLGLSSFLTSDNPLAMFNDTIELDLASTNKIEVLNTRDSEKQDFCVSDLLKDFVPVDTTPDNESVCSVTSISQKSQDALPGLDLLTPDSTGNPPPPTSFYRTMETMNEEPEHQYLPEAVRSSQWNNTVPITQHNSWDVPPVSAVRSVFAEPPASPPASRTPLAPHAPRIITIADQQDLPIADVDHRGILPPPPPPPAILPMLGHVEDVDHRLLPSLPPQPVPPPIRHTTHQDVDHRNLISLTHQPPVLRPHHPISLDQDYRLPPMIPPTDIVESVDMDLSEDEEQHGMYTPTTQNERRNSFNNNKVLVGGNDNINNNEKSNSNLIQINSTPKIRVEGPHSAPIMPPMAVPPPLIRTQLPHVQPTGPVVTPITPNILPVGPTISPPSPVPPIRPQILTGSHAPRPQVPTATQTPTRPIIAPVPAPLSGSQSAPVIAPLSNPFDNMPPNLKFNMPYDMNLGNYEREENTNNSAYEDDLRSRGLGNMAPDTRNPSPPDYADFTSDDWPLQTQRPFINQRFPRNWVPRTNLRPPGFSPQFWPRNVPRPTNRWMGPRPQRFW